MVSNFELKDLNEINELGTRLNPNFENLFHLDNLNENEKIYVYKENNKILGFIQISVNYEVCDLLNIIVDDKHRNKGIGSLLMDYMITDLPRNVQRILLEVNENNKDAIAFYYRFNFEIIRTINKYYGNNKALVMERKLQ